MEELWMGEERPVVEWMNLTLTVREFACQGTVKEALDPEGGFVEGALVEEVVGSVPSKV
jgi:hypothetical protein